MTESSDNGQMVLEKEVASWPIAVEKALARFRRATLLPDVTLKIVDLIQQGGYSAIELERIVGVDPALCLRILKVVNSPFYRRSEAITTIQQAIVVLGGAAIRNIAIATSFGRAFRRNGVAVALSFRELWRHSVAVGVGTRLLMSDAQEQRPDEAFLGGLLHDAGFVLELQSNDDWLSDVMSDKSGASRVAFPEAEERLFGASHVEFGGALCEKWHLPAFVRDAVSYHHDPSGAADENRSLVCAVRVADSLAHRNGIGFALDAGSEDGIGAAIDELELSRAELDDISESLPAMTNELVRILA